MKYATLTLTILAAAGLTGCSGKVLFVSNVALAVVPCALMYITLNLKKHR